MAENLNQFQIQLMLYYLTADRKKQTVTDAARYLKTNKVAVTRATDSLEKMNIMKKVEGRKKALTLYGVKLAGDYKKRLDIVERYMQYQDLTPMQAKENAMAALMAGFSEEYISRMEEQEERLRIKEVFAGRQHFNGDELCGELKDGNYYFPFMIYREHIKDGNNISMANSGFEHPCELVVKNHIGTIYLTVKTVSAVSAKNGRMMEGRIKQLSYRTENDFVNAGREGRYICFPADVLNFIAMGEGRERVLHGSVCMKMQCSVGDMHMPESEAIFTIFIS